METYKILYNDHYNVLVSNGMNEGYIKLYLVVLHNFILISNSIKNDIAPFLFMGKTIVDEMYKDMVKTNQLPSTRRLLLNLVIIYASNIITMIINIKIIILILYSSYYISVYYSGTIVV